MTLTILVEWAILLIGAAVAGFFLNVGFMVLLATLGRVGERTEGALTVACGIFLLAGYLLGWNRIPSFLALDWRAPLTANWIVLAAVVAALGMLSDDLSGSRRLRRFRHMSHHLNGWQRLWCVVALVILLPTLVIAAAAMPEIEDEVLADLRTGCAQTALGHVGYGEPCYHLSSFIQYNEQVGNEREYKGIVSRKRGEVALTALGVWLSLVSILYGFGLSAAWIRRGFRQKRA